MLKLQISKKAEKFLRNLPQKHQRQIAVSIMNLRQNGHGKDSKQLKGSSWYRSDAGEYRIIYNIQDKELLIVVLIGKRNDDDVYKRLNRL